MLDHLAVESAEVLHALGQRPHERSYGVDLFRQKRGIIWPNKSVQPTTAGFWLGFRFPLASNLAHDLPPSPSWLTFGLCLQDSTTRRLSHISRIVVVLPQPEGRATAAASGRESLVNVNRVLCRKLPRQSRDFFKVRSWFALFELYFYPKGALLCIESVWHNNRLDLTRHNGPLCLGAYLIHAFLPAPWRDGQPWGSIYKWWVRN
jgi:hypothetical protein